MSSDQKFEFESLQDTVTIKDFLQSLVDGMDKGRIVLSSEGDEIELTPSGLLNFKLKAKKKSSGSKMTMKISWKEAKKETALLTRNINISS